VGSAVGFPIKELRAMTASTTAVISPDAVLIDAARAGDGEAFGRLYASYTRLVHGVLLSRVPRDEVDDLLQDVFLVAFRKLHMLRDPDAFGHPGHPILELTSP